MIEDDSAAGIDNCAVREVDDIINVGRAVDILIGIGRRDQNAAVRAVP